MSLSIAREIDLFLERLRGLQPIERGIALRYFAECLPADPADRLALIAALAAPLPKGGAAGLFLGVSGEAMGLLSSLGAARSSGMHLKGGLPVMIERAELRVGGLAVSAQGPERAARPADLEPTRPPGAQSVVDASGRLETRIVPSEAGVIGTELLIVLAVAGLLIFGAGAAIAGSAVGVALAVTLALAGIYLWPLVDGLLAPGAPTVPASVRPQPEERPLSPTQQQTLCAAPGNGVPVAVLPPRARRNAGIWSRPPRKTERGHMLPVTLALVAGLLFAGYVLVGQPRVKAAIQGAHGHPGQGCGTGGRR